MIKKIETLSCIQEFVKDETLMEQYFSANDIASLKKHCSGNLVYVDSSDEIETDKVSRLIQLLLNSNLHLHVESYKDKVGRDAETF
jgi:uncharacterized protein (DUF927 family)